jgi:hypothetical protein
VGRFIELLDFDADIALGDRSRRIHRSLYDPPVRVVLANQGFAHSGGTEVYLLTVAEHFQRLGHEVSIYAHDLGPFSEHARIRGVRAYNELHELPGDCDALLTQDAVVAYELADRYPDARHVFRVCSDIYSLSVPPQLDGVVDVFLALSDRYARLAGACAVTTRPLRLRVPIDIDRLTPLGPIRPRPRRAVMLGNYPDRHELVREVWGRHGVEVTVVGGSEQRYDVAAAVADADIVVAKARAALDAMACGRAVYVFDMFGGDGWVTPDCYAALEADNFAGLATDRVIDATELARDLVDYDPRMGMVNRDLVVQHHSARDHVIDLVAAIGELRPRSRPTAPLREFARLTNLLWASDRDTLGSQRMQAWLHERLVSAEAGATETENELACALENAKHFEALAHGLQAQIEAMRDTHAWRLATRWWRLKRRFEKYRSPRAMAR